MEGSMIRILTSMLLAVMLLFPGVASADTVVEWQADDPKQGRDGFVLCTSTASAAGVTYINRNWVEADGRQEKECARFGTQDVRNFFEFNHVSVSPVLTESISIPASAVKTSVK
jgi:hypothetical protein